MTATDYKTTKSELPTNLLLPLNRCQSETDVTTQEPDTEVFTATITTVSSAQAQQVHQEEPEDVSITDTATEPVMVNAAVTEPTTITTTATLPKFTTISETTTTAGATKTPEPMTASESKVSEASTDMIKTTKSELPITMESTFTTEADSETKVVKQM